MSPETEALLNVVRDAENPSATDERRVLGAVRMTIAAGVVSSTAASVSSSPGRWDPHPSNWLPPGGVRGVVSERGLILPPSPGPGSSASCATTTLRAVNARAKTRHNVKMRASLVIGQLPF